jgi:hypothetical protein
LVEKQQGRTVRTLRLSGGWGIQLATLDGALTGLSPNGRLLVLSDNTRGSLELRARSRFAVINTRTLTLTKTISLRGDFSLDALSPDGRLVYLIHHVSKSDATKYQVQAYNLPAGRMLPGVVADKSQAGWIMAGYPVTRTSDRTRGAKPNISLPVVHVFYPLDVRWPKTRNRSLADRVFRTP